MHRVRGQWAKTTETQNRILDAAVEAFTEHGFNGTRMSDIVERAQSSTGSIYHHFGGKDELFQAISDRVTSEIEDLGDDWLRETLWITWRCRKDVRVLMNPYDRPEGYVPAGRKIFLARVGDGPCQRAMMSIMREVTLMLLETDDREEANRLVNAALRWVTVVQAIGF